MHKIDFVARMWQNNGKNEVSLWQSLNQNL